MRCLSLAALVWLSCVGCVGPDDVSLIAGGGERGYADGPAEDARFSLPSDVVSGGPGRLYVADQGNHAIRLIANAKVTTVAGNGSAGYADGRGGAARFASPTGLALDDRGRLVVADRDNNRVRRVDSDGAVTTIAGGAAGFVDGDASTARFDQPVAVAVSADGTIYVADRGNQRVRVIRGKQVSTLAGTGKRGGDDGDAAKASFDEPVGVAVSADGKSVYVVELGDSRSGRVRRIRDGKVETLSLGALAAPSGVALDSDDELIISEADSGRVRRISGTSLEKLDGAFVQPTGLAVDAPGNVFVADYGDHTIYSINHKQ